MADLYATENTKAFQSEPVQNVDAAKAGGRVRCVVDDYTFAAASVADVAYMGGIKIPAGAQIIDWTLDTVDLGTTTTLQLKATDGTTTLTLSSALDCNTAATVHQASEQQGNVPQGATVVSSLTLTVAGSAATGTVQLIVYYSID